MIASFISHSRPQKCGEASKTVPVPLFEKSVEEGITLHHSYPPKVWRNSKTVPVPLFEETVEKESAHGPSFSLPKGYHAMTDQELAIWYNDNIIYPDKVRLNCYYYHHYSFLKDIEMILATVIGRKVHFAGEEL